MPWRKNSSYSLWCKLSKWSWWKHQSASSPDCSEQLSTIQLCSTLLHMPSFLFWFISPIFKAVLLLFKIIKAIFLIIFYTWYFILHYLEYWKHKLCKNLESLNSFNAFYFATKLIYPAAASDFCTEIRINFSWVQSFAKEQWLFRFPPGFPGP